MIMMNAISPLDGRYQEEMAALAPYFSEVALFKYRLRVEVKYLLLLSKLGITQKLSSPHKDFLEKLTNNFNHKAFTEVKNYEKETKHDVKALEYFIKNKLNKTSLSDITEFIHFGLTSEDTNNLAFSLSIQDFLKEVFIPQLFQLITILQKNALENKNLVMLGRTHGQPAVPTTLGKELAVFAYRLQKITRVLKDYQLTGKLNGAVGNYNALVFTYPQVNWLKESKNFVQSLGLKFTPLTTQIESHDKLAELFQIIFRLNTVYISLCQDLWRYISDGYFILQKVEKEVGSSTMPQKVNPINFENAEGNLEIANSLFQLFIEKLPVSRLQRDLSSSTIRRNIGVAFGHSLLAYQSLQKGLAKISPNYEKIAGEVDNDWSILSEAVQLYLKTKGHQNVYEIVKKEFRGKKIKEKEYLEIINKLPIAKTDQEFLITLTPQKYVGLASYLVEKMKG